MKRISCVLLTGLLLQANNATPYEVKSHLELTVLAIEKSSVSDMAFTTDVLGLVLPYNSEQNTFLFEKFAASGRDGAEDPKNIVDLIKFGVDFEDHNMWFGEHRPINHFYDPQNNGSELKIPLTNYASPVWVLEPQELEQQQYSYRDARVALYDAITNSDFDARGFGFGRFFQILGQVVHHMQDMSQPEHVRADSHLTIRGFFEGLPEWFDIDPSQYEKYIFGFFLDDMIKNKKTIPNSNKVISNAYNNNEPVMFLMPHDYWGGPPEKGLTRKGAAEFTSSNFVSKDTNFSYKSAGIYGVHSAKHQFPDPANAITTSEDFSAVTDCALSSRQPSTVFWIGTDVVDEYLDGPPVFNKMSSSYSIFNSDLDYYNIDTSYFPTDEDDQPATQTALNSCTFNSAMGFLIPRAVAFSAGIIDYLMRGRIEISLPDEGVYGAVDHAQKNQPGDGFDKIKVKLRNTTADIKPVPGDRADTTQQPVVQHIHEGEMKAVVKYRLNKCYQSDLSGELKYVFGDPFPPAPQLISQQTTWSGCSGNYYYSGMEEIAVSQPIQLAAGESLPRNEAKTYTFLFSKKIPVNAIDVRLQVIFKGKLGSIDNHALSEPDAVVVASKDISEPSFVMVTNTSNYKIQLSDAENPARYIESGQGRQLDIEIRTHQTSPAYLLATSSLQVGEYSRLAILTDKYSQRITYNDSEGEQSVGDTTGFYFSEQAQSLVTNSRLFFNGRGMYFHSAARQFSDTEMIPEYDGLCSMDSTVNGQRYPSATEFKQLQESCRNLPDLVPDAIPVTLNFE